MKKNKLLGSVLVISAATAASFVMFACGGTSVGNPQVTLQVNPPAGPKAASVGAPRFNLAWMEEGLTSALFGVREAYAAVSSFSQLDICFDTVTFDRTDGTTEQVSGSSNITLNPGLMSFNQSTTNYTTIGSLSLTPNTILKDVKLTIATVPQLCNNAQYAVHFNSGAGTGGDIYITQNVAFRFDFPVSGDPITGGQQTITLQLGAIINGMVGLANQNPPNLNNSTIQTVNVGQAL